MLCEVIRMITLHDDDRALLLSEPVHSFGLPGIIWDYTKVLALPDDQFAAFYLRRMEEYRLDGWWTGNKTPKCFECRQPIEGPKELRRYHGVSLHPDCFDTWYEREGRTEDGMKTYWDRVANLRFE
jgi:hypothetical protein